MSGSGSFAVTRKHGGDRFYNPPAIRRHQQQQQELLLQQQQQLFIQRQQNLNQQLQHQHQQQVQVQGQLLRQDTEKVETREVSDYSTLSNRSVRVEDSTSRAAALTNIDRIVESVTPYVHAQHFSEARMRGSRSCESDMSPYFSLADVWESFKEWSVYGAGVPLEISESESVKQYYVPSLSGLQLYIDPMRVRNPGDGSDVKSSRETSSPASSDCEWEANHLNSQRMENLSLRDNPPMRSSTDEADASNSPGICIFEYLEQEQPYHRKPLFDKISVLASQSPELKMYRSCDLSPASWICVAWYPIYRIPVGPTLQNLDASFLTFHALSTHSTGKNQPQLLNSGCKSSTKFSLPVFGLASYKMKGSILTNCGDHERQQENSLLKDADTWLRSLRVYLPDYQFFVSHNLQGR